MAEARKREQQLLIDAEVANSQLNLAQASAYKGLEATTFEVKNSTYETPSAHTVNLRKP